MNKYNAKKTTIDDITFDSKLEANVYLVLKDYIKELQPKYTLQPSFKLNGKTRQAITYTADFLIDINGEEYVADSKGMMTQASKNRIKQFEYKFRQEVVIIKSKKHAKEWLEEKLNERD